MNLKDTAAIFTASTLATAAAFTRLSQSPTGQQAILLGIAVVSPIVYIGWNSGKAGRGLINIFLVAFGISLLLAFWGVL